ncbi:MAG: flagellar basal body-associated protein FliL [Phycisphaerales bacterium]|jgi:flagellar basal body-associated protein FliL
MADKETKDQDKKPKGKKNTMLVVAAMMLLEAVGVYVLVGVIGGGPSTAGASEIEGLEQLDEDAPVEILLVEDRFQNLDSGLVWGWEVEVYLKVRKKNEKVVNEILTRDANEIREGVTLIFRKARDRHLREPGMETMSHQLMAYVVEIFGLDSDELPLVDKIIVAKLKGTLEER